MIPSFQQPFQRFRKVKTSKPRNKFQRYLKKSSMVVMWALLPSFIVQVVLKLELCSLTDFCKQQILSVKCYLLIMGTVKRILLEVLVLLSRYADLYFSHVRTDAVLNICSLVTANDFSQAGWRTSDKKRITPRKRRRG